MSIRSTPYGTLPDGKEVTLFTLKNSKGFSAQVMNLGATLTALHVPDRDGNFADVVLGKDDFAGYLAGHPCFGSTCGRVAGRVSGAQFQIDGTTYKLQASKNQGGNNLHGGPEGFDQLLWNAKIIDDSGVEKLELKLIDPDGHNGFPGTLNCTVTYALLDDNSLQIEYQAHTDHTTPLNLTNHSYFNLCSSGNVLGHSVQIFADSVASVDKDSTLLGRRDPVVKAYNDYREPIVLGSLEKLEVGNADIHFFLNEGRTPQPELAAIVKEPVSGRTMEVLTTEPGVQFYAGLSLSEEGPDSGKGGIIHKPMEGLCLETQDYANSVNFPDMGGAVLQAGETFKSTTLYRFSAE